jgi:hypothetical protein
MDTFIRGIISINSKRYKGRISSVLALFEKRANEPRL